MLGTTRKSFLFDKAGIEVLGWLKSVCRVKSDVDVVRLGLGCLADLMQEDRNGSKIIIRAADGSERIYHPVFEEEEIAPEPVEALREFRAGIRKRAA